MIANQHYGQLHDTLHGEMLEAALPLTYICSLVDRGHFSSVEGALLLICP